MEAAQGLAVDVQYDEYGIALMANGRGEGVKDAGQQRDHIHIDHANNESPLLLLPGGTFRSLLHQLQ
jgi:hypothetical protein